MAAKAGETAYRPYFMAWWEFMEYQMPLTVMPGDFEDSLDSDEADLQKAYNVTFEQLNWRRWAIKNKCGNDTDKFSQVST